MARVIVALPFGEREFPDHAEADEFKPGYLVVIRHGRFAAFYRPGEWRHAIAYDARGYPDYQVTAPAGSGQR